MSTEPPEATPTPIQPLTPVLAYATPESGATVRVATYGTAEEAEMRVAELAAEGIAAGVFNSHTTSLNYGVMASAELHVRQADVARATQILALADSDAWEPDETAAVPTASDDHGEPLHLVPAATFDSPRKMREAHTLLASARVTSYLPLLVPRGDRPPGRGNRFVLQVAEEDLSRAQSVLREEEGDEEGEELHCPKCGSWRVYPVSHFWRGLASIVGLGEKPVEEIDCLVCRHRGPRSEFEPRS